MLPTFGLVYSFEQHEERRLAQAAQDQVQGLTAHLVEDYSDLVEDTRRLLASIARLPDIHTGGPGCRGVLTWYRETYPAYLNLGVIDRQGIVICSALRIQGRLNLGDRLYFRRVIATRQFAVGEYQIGITQKATVNFGYPILDSAGGVHAVVFAALDLGRLSRIEAAPVAPRGSVLTLIDREGIVLARSPDPERWMGHRLPETAVLTAIRSHDQGIVEAQGADGIPRLYGFAALHNLPGSGTLYASIGLPSDSASAAQPDFLPRNVGGLTLWDS